MVGYSKGEKTVLLSTKRPEGMEGGIDDVELPEMRANLRSQLEKYALPEIFNCDELALQ